MAAVTMPERTPGRDEQDQRRLARGEETALGELYDGYAPLVHGLAGRLLAEQAAAEQLTREVFAELWTRPEAYRPEQGSLRCWLSRLTRRRALERATAGRGGAEAEDPLGPPSALRQQVLDCCLARRPAALPLPAWAAPYAAEGAKLDALLRDLGPAEWLEVAELSWHGGIRRWRPAEVLCHLTAVDGFLAAALEQPDPAPPGGVLARSDWLIGQRAGHRPGEVRELWRRHGHELVRAAASRPDGEAPVSYGFAVLPLRDAFVDRAFECWVHGEDIARAVDYPYAPPAPKHLRRMVDLGARMLPLVLAESGRRGGSGRTVRLLVDGPAGGEWLIPLDGPADGAVVAEVIVDALEFCELAAARLGPDELALGELGDKGAVRELLAAAHLLSRP